MQGGNHDIWLFTARKDIFPCITPVSKWGDRAIHYNLNFLLPDKGINRSVKSRAIAKGGRAVGDTDGPVIGVGDSPAYHYFTNNSYGVKMKVSVRWIISYAR